MTQAIFLSYASQDADAARRICDALRAAGLEVWFDQSELRGGDAWDQSIRKQIKECALFVPVISANTNAREEGYFRLEWKLAVDRSHLMADDKAFFFPVILGETQEQTARVPAKFRERQWTRLASDDALTAFANHIAKVVDGRGVWGDSASKGASNGEFGVRSGVPPTRRPRENGDPASSAGQSLDPRLRVDDDSGSVAAASRAASSNAGNTSLQSSTKRLLIGVVAAAILTTIALFAAHHFTKSTQSTETEITSLAVLPFQLKSTDADVDYLSEGLAETLIYSLSQAPKVKVSPASSVRRFANKEIDPLKTGKELDVGAVMMGRIVQRGESLSISVELVDVRNNKSLWGEKYERKMADLLATQRDIASEIARKLQLRLSGEAALALDKRFTNNNEAYQLYLKGQYQYAKRGKENLMRAADFFQQAVKLDPGFAKAYVALADTYSIATFNEDISAKEGLPQAAAAAERALAIDPSLAEGYAAKASIAAMDWRWEDARRGFARAVELNPNVAETRYRYGLVYLLAMRRTDEAIAEMRRASELEPQSFIYAAVLTRAYILAGKADVAVEHAKKVHALDPEQSIALAWLTFATSAAEDHAETLKLVAKLRSVAGPYAVTGPAVRAYMALGKPDEALKEYRAFETQHRERAMSFQFATLAATVGKREEAFGHLEKAYAAKEPRLAFLQSDLQLIPLRDDPRFASLVKRVGLAP